MRFTTLRNIGLQSKRIFHSGLFQPCDLPRCGISGSKASEYSTADYFSHAIYHTAEYRAPKQANIPQRIISAMRFINTAEYRAPKQANIPQRIISAMRFITLRNIGLQSRLIFHSNIRMGCREMFEERNFSACAASVIALGDVGSLDSNLSQIATDRQSEPKGFK